MYAVTTIFIWMCLGGSTLAHHSHEPCHEPPMTGAMSVLDALKGEMKAVADYSYDPVAKKLHFKENSTHLPDVNRTSNLDLMMFFEEGVFYEIDNKNQSCEKKALQMNAHAFEIHHDAKYLTEMTVGSASTPGEGMKVNVWTGALPEIKSHYSVSTTTTGCVPLGTLLITDSMTLVFTNLNVVTEIKDPDVFSLPAFCESVELEETPEGTVNSFFSLFI